MNSISKLKDYVFRVNVIREPELVTVLESCLRIPELEFIHLVLQVCLFNYVTSVCAHFDI